MKKRDKHTCITEPFSKDCSRCVYLMKVDTTYMLNYTIRREREADYKVLKVNNKV